MIENKGSLLQNSNMKSSNLNNYYDKLNVSSPTNNTINFNQTSTQLNSPVSNSPNYSFKNNDESEYSFYNNLQINENINEEINYLNQENDFQTPIMKFNINNPNETEDEKNKSLNFNKFLGITSETNDSSKIVKLDSFPNLPNIENIVSTANLCVKLNLREIALQSKNAEYNPKRFSAVIMKIKDPKTTGLIFSTGRIVCLGAKNEEESRRACRKIAKIIKSVGYPILFKEYEIQNIVGSADVKHQLSLINLYMHLIKRTLYKGKNCVAYEPEQFPGLIYRMIEPNIVLLIFSSGKIVLTGGKKKDDIYNGFKKIFPLLIKFKVENKLTNNKILHKDLVKKMKEIIVSELKEN